MSTDFRGKVHKMLTSKAFLKRSSYEGLNVHQTQKIHRDFRSESVTGVISKQ